MVQEASKGPSIFILAKKCKPKPLLVEIQTDTQVTKRISKPFKATSFLLERYIFVSKLPTLIEISDIHQVVFSRVGAGAGASTGRTFDLKIVTKGGAEYNFTSINRDEHEITETYLKDKKVRVKNEMVPDADLLLAAVAGGDDDDDDMQVSSVRILIVESLHRKRLRGRMKMIVVRKMVGFPSSISYFLVKLFFSNRRL